MTELEVCPLDELPPGRTKIVHAGLVSVCVYNLDGELYALEDRCSHDDGPLCEGEWEEDTCRVICPRHGSAFDLRSGRPSPCRRSSRWTRTRSSSGTER